MRSSEALFLATTALAACRSDGREYAGGQMGTPYDETQDTASVDTVDTGLPQETGTPGDTACDTDGPCDTDTQAPTQEVITATVAMCQGALEGRNVVDLSEYVKPYGNPSLDAGSFADQFTAIINRDVAPNGEQQTLFACAEFVPTRCEPEILGTRTIRDLETNDVTVELEAGAGREGSLQLWIGTLDESGQPQGFTYPDAQTPHTARNYTLVDDDVIR